MAVTSSSFFRARKNHHIHSSHRRQGRIRLSLSQSLCLVNDSNCCRNAYRKEEHRQSHGSSGAGQSCCGSWLAVVVVNTRNKDDECLADHTNASSDSARPSVTVANYYNESKPCLLRKDNIFAATLKKFFQSQSQPFSQSNILISNHTWDNVKMLLE